MAANMGALAESFGAPQGIKYRKPIKEALLTVLRLDPDLSAGIRRIARLGRWYFKVRACLGAATSFRSSTLRESLKYNENSTASHFFLAELFIDDGRQADARLELQKVLDAPLDPQWTPEDREFKEKARKLLASLK
jgi:hypothetical protein